MLRTVNKKSGFTIVELLIVIVVIVILAALVIANFSGIKQKSRDTERTTDIRALQTALEGAYGTVGYYPTLDQINAGGADGWRTTNLKGLDAAALCDPNNATNENCTLLASETATDYAYKPLKEDGTTCATGDICTQYSLVAKLEGKVDNKDTYTKTSMN